MIDELKKNIETELAIVKEISDYQLRLSTAELGEDKIINETIASLTSSIKIINDSIPQILNSISVAKPLPAAATASPANNKNKKPLEKINFESAEGKVEVVLSPKKREEFLKEISISEDLIKRLKKKEKKVKEERKEFKAARGYLKLSNRFFQNLSISLINKGYFKPLALNLKKSNIDILFQTYVAMILFTTFISIIAGLLLTAVLFFFNAGLGFLIVTPIIIPIITFLSVYQYPSSEKNSIERKIERELPFAVIHMSAISGSGIEPAQIFRIIGLGREYPNLAKEIRKVLNQINLYGYDLVTALNNISKGTSSEKLAELFSGLATTITSGGNLNEFFAKRAETLLNDYRLEREKFTKIAETFMDIYISVVIAAPMILMLLVVIISISGIKVAFTSGQLTTAIILIIVLINIIFLGVLHLKQPKY